MNRNGDILKIIAMMTMLIDHIGYLYYPSLVCLRIIGRIAFPIFAFLIARGYRFTSNKTRYGIRLFAFGMLSQVPYHYFAPGKLNIMFSLFIGLVLLKAYDSNHRILTLLLLATGFYPAISYGVYGLTMMLIFHICYGKKEQTAVLYLLLSAVYYTLIPNWVQAFSVMALFPILFEPPSTLRLPKMLSYWFYPVHITLLMLGKLLIN